MLGAFGTLPLKGWRNDIEISCSNMTAIKRNYPITFVFSCALSCGNAGIMIN